MIPLCDRFLSQLTDALVSLLEGGAAREPEIIEPVYTHYAFSFYIPSH